MPCRLAYVYFRPVHIDAMDWRQRLQELLYFGIGNRVIHMFVGGDPIQVAFGPVDQLGGCITHPSSALIIIQGGPDVGKVFCTMCETTMLPTELFQSQ